MENKLATEENESMKIHKQIKQHQPYRQSLFFATLFLESMP